LFTAVKESIKKGIKNMKTHLKIFCIIFFMLFCRVNTNAQAGNYDLTVRITEGDINNILAALIDARVLNWGEYIDGFVNTWIVNVDQATVDIQPNNVAQINVNLVASANFDLLFQPTMVTHPIGAYT